jgi:hypothetical protein
MSVSCNFSNVRQLCNLLTSTPSTLLRRNIEHRINLPKLSPYAQVQVCMATFSSTLLRAN